MALYQRLVIARRQREQLPEKLAVKINSGIFTFSTDDNRNAVQASILLCVPGTVGLNISGLATS